MKKHYIKRDDKIFSKCIEPCPFLNKGKSEIHKKFNGIMIGSGACQGCKHLKNSNLIEKYGKNYSVFEHGPKLFWIQCDKIND